MKHIKQLDTIRAIAIILVIICHWIPATSLINKLPNGALGVDIFFVLSGFLITSILFSNRLSAEENQQTKWSVLKNFYLRRTLRIFPVYYLTIFLLFIFQASTLIDIRPSFLYYVTYTQNFYFFNLQEWPGSLSHFWSLAVEEQFYLVWPFAVLLVRRKYILHLVIVFILIGVISQCVMRNVNMNTALTFTCFDAFGMGALLSWVVTFRQAKLRQFFYWLSIFAAICLLLFIIVLLPSVNKFIFIPQRTLHSIMALWVITYILINHDNKTLKGGFVFNNRALIFLGKISYGLYLYHNLIPATINSKFVNIYLNPLLPDWLYIRHWGELFLVENAILLLLLSWLSYVIVEKPFLKLKDRFVYRKPAV